MNAASGTVSPRRKPRASPKKSAAPAVNSSASGLTPLEMNANVGWKATASAPTVHAHGRRGIASRRNSHTNSTVSAPNRQDSSRMSVNRV